MESMLMTTVEQMTAMTSALEEARKDSPRAGMNGLSTVKRMQKRASMRGRLRRLGLVGLQLNGSRWFRWLVGERTRDGRVETAAEGADIRGFLLSELSDGLSRERSR